MSARVLWREALSLRSLRVAFAIQVVAGITMLAVPLFAALGFERAFVHGLLTPPCTGVIAISLVRRFREKALEASPLRSVLMSATLGAASALPSALVGRIYESIHATCNPIEGAWFLASLTSSGALLAAGVATSFALLTARRFIAGFLFSTWLLSSLGVALWRLYSEPQIFVYSLPFGFWPGSLYDEDVSLSLSLVAHRGMAALFGLALGSLASAFGDGLVLRFRAPRWESIASAAVFAGMAFAVAARGQSLGFDRDRASIDAELSRKWSGRGFVIHADPSIGDEGGRRLRSEVAYVFDRLEVFFGRRPRAEIGIRLYRDAGQKKALMGASGTQIARPWASEVHIDGFEVPHGSLRHELAHVFAGELSDGLFRVPARFGVFVSIGLVEGIAVAADWPVTEGMTVHEWARAMRVLKLAPDPRELFSPTGFWAVSASRAYTVAGSFVRYLIETHGIARFSDAYRTGDLEAAYGRSLHGLALEWASFVDRATLTPGQLALAEARFSRPSIFEKVCAHTTSALAAEASAALSIGDVDVARELYRRVMTYDPQRSSELVDVAEQLLRQGRQRDGDELLSELEARPLGKRRHAEVRMARADSLWRRDRLDEAEAVWTELDGEGLGQGDRRLMVAKREAAKRDPGLSKVLRAYLLGELSPSASLARLGELARQWSSDGLVRYLYAKRLENAWLHDEAIREVQAARTSTSPPLPETLGREAERLYGRSLFRTGRFEAASGVFRELSEAGPDGEVLVDADWAARAEHAFRSRGLE
ncbi:MAG: hypothetical protein HY791_37585 [Deltaproteobacteria bacterium]|nr:hypothetical protein [Deltaproteobacteria bacterium]